MICIKLGKAIPKAIKVRVLKDWLRGLPRDRIAVENKIGYGTVSEIIGQFRLKIVDIDLLRAVSTELRRQGFDLYHIGASIRLKRKLDKINLPEERIENVLEQMSIHCFQEDTDIEPFFAQIDKVTQMANTIGISIFDIPEIIERGKREIARLDELILIKTREISKCIVAEGITKKDLEEYRVTRPIADRIKELEWELKGKDRTIRNYLRLLGN